MIFLLCLFCALLIKMCIFFNIFQYEFVAIKFSALLLGTTSTKLELGTCMSIGFILKMSRKICSKYSQTCLSDPLYITSSFVSWPYLFLPSVFPCNRPLYNNPLSNATNDCVLWVKILHITTIRGLLSNRKLDNK